MKRISFLPRWVHKLYAWYFGKFWLPCPLCNRYFGGHETKVALMDNKYYGRCVCKACSEKAKKYNEKWYK